MRRAKSAMIIGGLWACSASFAPGIICAQTPEQQRQMEYERQQREYWREQERRREEERVRQQQIEAARRAR